MRVVAIVVILLLSLVTFNAYACLVPLYSSAMDGNCPSSHTPQTPTLCDVFKTLGVESTATDNGAQHGKSYLAYSFDVIAPLQIQGSPLDASEFRPPTQDLFLKLAVLRI
jgi:hypothetical protein